jgi:hypothetical protein
MYVFTYFIRPATIPHQLFSLFSSGCSSFITTAGAFFCGVAFDPVGR